VNPRESGATSPHATKIPGLTTFRHTGCMWIPGWGEALCGGTTRAGTPCCNHEVATIGYCLHHAPDELLEPAEAIMGFKRCRKCRFYAVAGTDPPRCKVHGANQGSKQWQWARLRVREAKLRAQYGLPPAPSAERIAAALMDVEAVYGRYKPPRRKTVA
jgi:hypothetical protein